MKRITLPSFLLLLCCLCTIKSEDETAFQACDEDSVSISVPVSSLTPNTFHKICADNPSSHASNRPFGSPQCGDGTPYGFFLSKPVQKKANKQKILIEFSGGGACWSDYTCQKQEYYLTFPEYMSKFPGRSCTELQAGIDEYGAQASMLCAKTIGDVDLTSYNSVIVPYCTQDVHTGDAQQQYSDDWTVQHKGAHNLMTVLRYIYQNFPNPSHIVLTGCSAGGTALPLAYHLLHHHYNHFAGVVRSTQISVIADSPVYLTPSYFLENVIDNWNPWTLAKRIGFDYEKYKYNSDYSTIYLDYILKKGSSKDRWGFVGHEVDPISEIYYTWMSGNGEEERQRRQLSEDNNDDDYAEAWWTELTESLGGITTRHKNVDTFWINDSEGHCTFGLYYPLMEEGFESWAANIMAESDLGGRAGFGHFALSAVAGLTLIAGIFYAKRQGRSMENGDFLKYEDKVEQPSNSATTATTTTRIEKIKGTIGRYAVPALQRLGGYPITVGYAFVVSLYLGIMLSATGFAHPLNNPALGPSAIDLSLYGINNPSLIVYQMQIFRLVTSSFLCSGVLTWMLTLLCLWFYARPLEIQLGMANFAIVMGLLIFGTNLIYALTGNGASCSSIALILGLNTFAITVRHQLKESSKCMITTTTILLTVLVVLVFSFNSWIMILAALALGIVFALGLFKRVAENPLQKAVNDDLHPSNLATTEDEPRVFVMKTHRLYTVLAVYATLFLVLLMRLRKPNALYIEAFYTGCDLKYSDEIGDLASGYFDDRRRLSEDDGDADLAICAQFCVPHLASRGVAYGARKVFEFPIQDGTCVENGYEEHVADKTFKYFSYSLDVEVYQDSDYSQE